MNLLCCFTDALCCCANQAMETDFNIPDEIKDVIAELDIEISLKKVKIIDTKDEDNNNRFLCCCCSPCSCVKRH